MGIGNNITLSIWILPTLQKKPSSHQNYNKIMQHFGIDPSLMAKLFDPNSMLMRLSLLMFNL